MDLVYCEKCHKWFDINDEYDAILIAKKITVGYEWQHFCQNCGKKIHDTIKTTLKRQEEMKINNDLDCIRLLKAVVKIKELCSNRKSCNGCVFDNDVIGLCSNCALAATVPSLWDLNNIQQYLNTHEE